MKMDMESPVTAHQPLPGMDNLRKRAEARLLRDLEIDDTSRQHDMQRQLYELRINQIEFELLSEEFNRLTQSVSINNRRRLGGGETIQGYMFLDGQGRLYDAKFSAQQEQYANKRKCTRQYLSDYVVEEQRMQLQEFLHSVCANDSQKTCELQFEQAQHVKDQCLKFPLYGRLKAVCDDEKKICLVVVEDITIAKLAELREKSKNTAMAVLNKTIAASRNEIYMFDSVNLHFSFANQRALENLGYTLDELTLMTPADIQTKAFSQPMNELINDVKKHKKNVKKFNAVHLRKDGTLYPVEIYLQLFEQDNDSSFIAIVLDVSSQQAIESQLKSIVESADAIIWAADINMNIVFMSDQVLEILGYSANQFVGYTLQELLDSGFIHEDDRTALSDGFTRVIQGGNKVSDLRFRARHADETWRWLSVNMTPNRTVDGQICQLIGVIHDIHAQKWAEDALLKLNQELDSRVQEEIHKNMEKDLLMQRQSRLAGMGEMIGNIAHQWRQPLNSLSLILTNLEDAAAFGECDLHYLHESVTKSKQIIQKMSTTIDDFRHFFRPDKSPGLFSLKQVADECLNLIDGAMRSNNIDVTVQCEHDVQVNGYANECSQAVMNILSNAKDAIVDNKISPGKITINIHEEIDYGVYSVTDNGGGIDAQIMPRIFEPHFSTKPHGFGIGLYMTLVSVEKNMKGKILVENVQDGAKFSVYLPKATAGGEHAVS